MKKIVLLLAVLIVSIGNLTMIQAQTWTQYPTPASATSLTLTSSAVYIFTTDRYYVASLPLPQNTANVQWAEMLIPGSGSIKNSFAASTGEVFALRENGDLYKLQAGQWTIETSDIQNMSVGQDRFFFWSQNVVNEWNHGICTSVLFQGAKAVTYNLDNVFVFDENRKYWQGPDLGNLQSMEELADMNFSEAAMFGDTYVTVGEVVGGLAAWFQSPVNVCYKYTHILTAGNLNSVTAVSDTAWVAGWLGNKGCIFNTHDLASIEFFPETIWQIRSNANQTVAAVSTNVLYVRGGTASLVSVSKTPKLNSETIKVSPNPITNGQLRLFSDGQYEKNLLTAEGKLVARLQIETGENIFSLNNLPCGVYVISPGGQKVVIK